MAELPKQEHLQERGFLVDQEIGGKVFTVPGPPYRLTQAWWQKRRPAPRIDEHGPILFSSSTAAPKRNPRRTDLAVAKSELPLAGVRVLDFTWVWAGPYCTLQLAHLGADVIKIESGERTDIGRRLAVYPKDMKPGINRSGYFNQWSQGKRSLGLDFSRPDAITLAKELVKESDVVTENFASGVMDRLGLGWDVLREINPNLIMASVSGFGHTGPLSDYSAYGPATPPLSGLSALTGYRGGPPSEIGIAFGDPTAGITAAAGICAALMARETNGGGQYIDVSLWEATAVVTAEGWLEQQMTGTVPDRMGNRDRFMAPQGCFRCQGEDNWISIACASDEEWQALCGVMQPELLADARFVTQALRKQNEDALDAMMSAWTLTQEGAVLTRALQEVGVAAYPSLSPKDLSVDEQLVARDFFSFLEHPEVGVRQHTGIPWRVSNGPNGVRSAAPLLGQDTDQVLGEILGYSREKILALRAEGTIC